MRQRLYHRLTQLEAANALVRREAERCEREADSARSIRTIELFLRVRGVERQGQESLMEAWARALGIALTDLRNMLMAGVDPIRKYFTEHGIYEEIERRKAAGTWPAAGGKEARCQPLIE